MLPYAEEALGEEPAPPVTANAVAVFGQLKDTHPEAFQELLAWLAAALVKDQYARLNEGGHSHDHRIPLARVFVDLVASPDGADSADPEPEDPSEPLEPGVVASLLAVQPGRPPRREGAADKGALAPEPAGRGHCVLIAGPGQGKSTVVQYLSQLHRLAFLRPWRDRLEARAREALDVLEELCKAQRLPEPASACLPLFIPLSRFAAWLSRERPESVAIERFLAYHAFDTSRLQLSAAALELAMSALPWLLVLDGLDEVPDPGDRQRALEAVDRLLEKRSQARCIVVATTRPQSYSGEFGGLGTRTLCAMSKHRALTYARHLLAGRYATEGERRRQIEERLAVASKEPATARLMRTPLQVTIMTALLAEAGRAPVERWRLFRDFYNVIVRRESDRDPGVARVLSKFRTHLDAVHERAGLLLQVDCERGGGSDASLDRARFMEIVEQRLTEEGYSRTDASEHARELARIAEDRLVLLTGVRAGRVGFELRSFQELMAAEALMSGRESAVIERVRVIARSSAWTNVLLFMASGAMATSSSLRDDFTLGLCRWLDDPARDPTAAALRAGARWALELLDEGALASSPALLRDVTAHALSLLELPPAEILGRLAATLSRLCLDPETKEHVLPLVLDRLDDDLSTKRPGDSLAGWIVALALTNEDLDAVRALVDSSWPDDIESERRILEALRWVPDLSSRSVRHRLPALIPRQPLELLKPHVDAATWCGEWANAAMWGGIRSRFLDDGKSTFYRYRAMGIGETLDPPEAYREVPYWRVATAVSQFESRPEAETLAEALDTLAEHATSGVRDQLMRDGSLSWVLEACVRAADGPDGFRALAARARAGDLGQAGDWRAAEERWRSAGTSEEDLIDFIEHDGLPHCNIAKRGAGFGSLQRAAPLVIPERPGGDRRATAAVLATLVRLRRRATSRRLRGFFCKLILDGAERVYAAVETLEEPLTVADLAELAREHELVKKHQELISLNAVLALVGAGGDAAVRAALIWLSQQRSFGMRGHELRPQPIADIILRELRASPGSRDLFRVLGYLPLADRPMAPVPEEVTVVHANDGASIEASILTLEVHRGGLSPERAMEIGARLVKLSTPENAPGLVVLWLLEKRKNAFTDGDVALVRAIMSGLPGRVAGARASALKLLQHHCDSLTTSLARAETWEALRLPLPAPLPLPASTAPSDAPRSAVDVPVHLREIEVHGLRCYSALQMADLHEEPERGQWIIVLGENGAGKTTLLRALAMALVGREVGILALGSSEPPYRRPGAQRATIDVRMRGAVYQASIDGENGHERFFIPSSPETERPFVVGYGCRRGSTLGAKRVFDHSRLAATRTLFDDPQGSLIPGEQWLKDLHSDAAIEQPRGAAGELLDAVLDVIHKLLPDVERPTIDKDGVWVKGPATGGVTVRLAAMSDGYLTSLGWAVDMMARWIKQKQDAGRRIAQPFHRTMTGVVLLDELDLHLHPRWQVRVVRDLKKLFPRMTFVVTTHNPMTLVGAHKREIWTLQRDPESGMSARRHDTDPRLRTGSELYARFFGLAELYPDELGRDLRRYGFLASSPYRSDEEEREVQELFLHLQQEGIDPGFAPAPREGS